MNHGRILSEKAFYECVWLVYVNRSLVYAMRPPACVVQCIRCACDPVVVAAGALEIKTFSSLGEFMPNLNIRMCGVGVYGGGIIHSTTE